MQSAQRDNRGDSADIDTTLCPAASNIAPSTPVPLTLVVGARPVALAVGRLQVPLAARREEKEEG